MMKWIQPLMPVQFDENEIYGIVVTSLILTAVIWLQNKDRQLTSVEMIFIWLFNLFYSSLGDYFLAMPPYDLYDTVDRNSGELMDIILQNIGYPGFAFITVHYYLKFKPKKLYYLGYVLLSILVTLLVEIIGVKFFNLYTYKNWTAFRSFLFYIPVFLLNFWLSDKVRTYINRKTDRDRLGHGRG